MENASKALIIAASVLLAIMVVALGVRIFTKAQNATDTSKLEETEIAMFNSKFEGYEGTQLGSNVKTLLSKAISNASTNKDDKYKLPKFTVGNNVYTTKGSTVAGTSAGGESAVANNQGYINALSEIKSSITSSTSYKVTFTYATDGLIQQIDITIPTT